MSARARTIAISPPLLAALLALAACPSGSPDGGKPIASNRGKPIGDPKPDDAKAEPEAKSPGVTEAVADSQPMGRVLDGPLPIAGLIGKPPAEVQAQLSEPLAKGMARGSCVRFVPERTWFSCKFALQRYGDKGGAYKAIGVEYEDGVATTLAFEGPTRAEGTVDPRAALAYVGLELPGEPKLDTPDAQTQVWSWFNGAARLRIDGHQYRVVVSSVGADWSRTKIELILNDPLSDEQRARVMPVGQPSAPG
jgi:hypothetical protein